MRFRSMVTLIVAGAGLALAVTDCAGRRAAAPDPIPATDLGTGSTAALSVPIPPAHLSALQDSVRSVPDTANRDSDSVSGDWVAEDWRILSEKVRWAEGMRLDTLDFGTAVAEMGRTFVGWTYTPQTLEVEGPERIVVNLRELDCVTFVENALALVRFQRRHGAAALDDPAAARTAYEALLEEIRYRNGALSGYPSRLHYFSEWLSDNAARGLVEPRTAELGGIPDDEPIDFMSTHPDAYRQLADPAALAEIRAIEARLGAGPGRVFIPQERIGDVADRIREGDVIAATSTVPGLDIAHTGIAVRVDGRLHLMHAPLVGSVVEISELPLAERILDIRGQDGIMVATPLPGPEGRD